MKTLKDLRIKNNIKIKEMAALLGISEPFYSQLENGKRTLTYAMAKKIAAIFKLKPDDIFYDYF